MGRRDSGLTGGGLAGYMCKNVSEGKEGPPRAGG